MKRENQLLACWSFPSNKPEMNVTRSLLLDLCSLFRYETSEILFSKVNMIVNAGILLSSTYKEIYKK